MIHKLFLILATLFSIGCKSGLDFQTPNSETGLSEYDMSYVKEVCYSGHKFLFMRGTYSINFVPLLEDDGKPVKCVKTSLKNP